VQISAFTDYSLRVLIYAAAHDGRVCTVEEIASAFAISRHHLVKVVNQLGRLGYLDTRRGRGGGFTLACVAGDTRLGEVVRRVEGNLALVECFDRGTNACPLARGCGVKSALREAFDAFFAVLDRYTLADMVAQPRWAATLVSLLPLAKSRHA